MKTIYKDVRLYLTGRVTAWKLLWLVGPKYWIHIATSCLTHRHLIGKQMKRYWIDFAILKSRIMSA